MEEEDCAPGAGWHLADAAPPRKNTHAKKEEGDCCICDGLYFFDYTDIYITI